MKRVFLADQDVTYFAIRVRGKVRGKIHTAPLLLTQACTKVLFALLCVLKRRVHGQISCSSLFFHEGSPFCTKPISSPAPGWELEAP